MSNDIAMSSEQLAEKAEIYNAVRRECLKTGRLSLQLGLATGALTIVVSDMSKNLAKDGPSLNYQSGIQGMYYLDGGMLALSVVFYGAATALKSKIRKLQNETAPAP